LDFKTFLENFNLLRILFRKPFRLKNRMHLHLESSVIQEKVCSNLKIKRRNVDGLTTHFDAKFWTQCYSTTNTMLHKISIGLNPCNISHFGWKSYIASKYSFVLMTFWRFRMIPTIHHQACKTNNYLHNKTLYKKISWLIDLLLTLNAWSLNRTRTVADFLESIFINCV